MTPSEFRALVEAHLKQSGEKATPFGKRALGDPAFVFDLRAGRNVSLDVVERVLTAIRKPNGASKPKRRAA